MKLLTVLSLVALLATTAALGTAFRSQQPEIEVSVAPNGDVSFKLKNDTGQTIRIHDGRGEAAINNGTVRPITRPEGTKIMLIDGARKRLLFTVSADMEGRTLKVSDY
jgi:hypothetical protein